MINYLICIIAIAFGLLRLNQKAAVDPEFKMYGIGIKDLRIMAYLGIAAFAILILFKINS